MIFLFAQFLIYSCEVLTWFYSYYGFAWYYYSVLNVDFCRLHLIMGTLWIAIPDIPTSSSELDFPVCIAVLYYSELIAVL